MSSDVDVAGRLGPEWGEGTVTEAASDIRLTRAIWILSLALVLYDYMLTFGDEVHFMWSKQLAWTRILFIMSRYWTILNLIIHNVVLALASPPDLLYVLHTFSGAAHSSIIHLHRCRIWYFYVIFATAGTSLTTTIIAQLRIYAMYECNRRLLMIMAAAICLSLGVQGPILLVMVIKAKTFQLPPVFTGCYAAVPHPYLLPYWVAWIPYLTYECFIFALALYKSVLLAQDQPETPLLIYVLIRDTIVFFGGTFAVVLLNCLVNAFGRPTIFSAFSALYIALYSVLGCRMLLNVRAAANPWSRYETALYYGSMIQPRTGVSTIEFARNHAIEREMLEEIELEPMSSGSGALTPPHSSTRERFALLPPLNDGQ